MSTTEQIDFLRGRQRIRLAYLLKLWKTPWQVRGEWWEAEMEQAKQAWLSGEASLIRLEFLH